MSKELLINEEIHDPEVRVIDADGSQLGILKIADAIAKANERQLDLVKIAPTAKPPVCKIMDYGKHRFEQAKKEKEIRKNQKVTNIKEIRFTPTIDQHDIETKVKNLTKMLKAGDKVKVTVRFRGREVAHASMGEELLKKVAEMVSEYGTIDKAPKLEGRNMAMFIVSKSSK